MADSDLSGEEILHPGAAQARIEELEGFRSDFGSEEDWQFEYGEEWTSLTGLRTLVISKWGEVGWTDNAGLVRDSYWDDYQAERAHDIYGEVTETLYWDDKKWAEDQKQDFDTIEWDGATWYGDKG